MPCVCRRWRSAACRRCARDAYAAIPPRLLPTRFRAALERVGRRLRRIADHHRQRRTWIERRDEPSVGGIAAGADYWFSPTYGRGLCAGRRRHQFSSRQWRQPDDPTCSRPARSCATQSAPPTSPRALAYGWQDITTDRTVTVAGIDRLAGAASTPTLSPVASKAAIALSTPWMGVTPYAAGQVTAFELPAYAESVLSPGPIRLR